VRQVDHLSSGARDLERSVDRRRTRGFDVAAGVHGLEEPGEGDRVQLDQFLGAEPDGPSPAADFGRAAPALGADGDLLDQGGGGGHDRRGGRPARRRGGAGGDLVQEVAETGAGAGLRVGCHRKPSLSHVEVW
jgi:hypothetical protein